MFKRRRGVSASQSKSTSKKIQNSMLGSHAARPSRSAPTNAAGVGFSSARKKRRATKGFVSSVLPSGDSRGSGGSSNRLSRKEYTQQIKRRSLIQRVVIIAASFLLVVFGATFVGGLVFLSAIDNKILLENEELSSVLTPAKEEEPFYTLVAADLDLETSSQLEEGYDAFALVRIDTSQDLVTLVSIPANVKTYLSSGDADTLSSLADLEGDAALVSAVSQFSDVEIAHFVKINAEGIVSLVDSLGGVTVEVSEEVDDPAAGNVYIPAGIQALDGAATLTFLRATNFTEGLELQAANQQSVLSALSLRLLEEGNIDFLLTLDEVSEFFRTTMGAGEARDMAESLRDIDSSTILGAMVPGYESEQEGKEFFIPSNTSWVTMMAAVDSGQDPVVPEEITTVDPGSFTLTVRNGAAITGTATEVSEILLEDGFLVDEVGNTDTSVYPETLVVYRDPAMESAANTVVSAIGMGRVVYDTTFYVFETDVLLIIGGDWVPIIV